jgi:hypothetical protein
VGRVDFVLVGMSPASFLIVLIVVAGLHHAVVPAVINQRYRFKVHYFLALGFGDSELQLVSSGSLFGVDTEIEIISCTRTSKGWSLVANRIYNPAHD